MRLKHTSTSEVMAMSDNEGTLWPEGTTVESSVLDELHRILCEEAIGAENAITSGELADRVVDETAEANPSTRRAVLEVMQHGGVPVIGSNSGYYIPQDEQAVEAAVDALKQRRQGIKKRERLLRGAWKSWDGPDCGAGADQLSPEERKRIKADPVLEIDDVVQRGGEA